MQVKNEKCNYFVALFTFFVYFSLLRCLFAIHLIYRVREGEED